jgi:hypothetical protein
MPDICMCKNEKCPKKEECYRYMAKPSEWQSYIEFKNICNEENNYQWFWQMENKPIVKEGK